MKIYKTSIFSLCVVGLLALLSSCNKEKEAEALPNIVYIMADDLGYGDLSCYGATKIHTPNIDALASEGTKFNDVHSPSSVCTPTRYGVLTGRYCWRGRLKKEVLWSGYDPLLIEKDRKTIGNMMQEAGYHTAQIGKWHLGWEDKGPVDYTKGYLERGPKDLGFDYSFVTAGAQNLYPLVFVENHKLVSNLKKMDYDIHDPKSKGLPEGEVAWHKRKVVDVFGEKAPMVVAEDWEPYQVDQVYKEKAITFISNHVKETPKKPFYLHLTLEAPHRPNIMPDFMMGTSKAGMRGDHVQLVDYIVGEIRKTLADLNLDDNTLVILTSDNGGVKVGVDGKKLKTDFGHDSSGILTGFKGQRNEGGHRVPFIAKWPGKVPQNKVSESMFCLTDMMASFAAITGYKLDKDMGEDSFNAYPSLLGENKQIRETVIHHDYQGRFSIRKGYWKLTDEKLYNLEKDIEEMHDVAKENPTIVKELKVMLEKQKNDGRTAFR